MKSHINDNIINRGNEALALAKKLGATAAIVNFSHSETRSISFEANNLKSCDVADRQNYEISVIINGRRGSVMGNIPEAMNEMVERAATFAQRGATAHYDVLPEPAKVYPTFGTYSDTVPALANEKIIHDCQSIIDALLSADDSLVVEAGGSCAEAEALVMNSAGLFKELHSTAWNLLSGYQKTTGTDMLFSGAERSGVKVDERYNCQALIEDGLFDLKNASKIVKVDGGKLPVFLPPDVLKRFLTPIISGVNGRNVYKGTSPLKNKLGQTVFSPKLTIVDNPHLDFCGTSCAFDNCGIPSQKITLVENGVLKSFLYDYDTAKMAGEMPTGNSECKPYKPLVMPGDASSDDMLCSIKRGLYVKQMLGFGQTNIANGDFSANVLLAFLIEDGQIVGRVKDVMIGGNIFELLKGEISFSSNVHPVLLEPYAIIPDVDVRA